MRVVKTVDVGCSFGDLALQVAGGVRAATVRAADFCELLILSGFVYRQVLAKHHREDMNNRVRCQMATTSLLPAVTCLVCQQCRLIR